MQSAVEVVSRSERRAGAIVADLCFALLVCFNTIRLFRHTPWRDELQAFMLASASGTPLELFAKLKYEGHPGLWHLVLWLITRVSADPLWMQVTHLVIALGIWILIWRFSPFTAAEKLLLLLSYFLFWEYFVVSRSYALGVLLGFAFIALRMSRPDRRFWPWLLLGLLANTSVMGTIWSLGLAAFYALQSYRAWRRHLGGAALYLLLLALAIATMVPASDAALSHSATPHFSQGRLDVPLLFSIGAFFPFSNPFLSDAVQWIGGEGFEATAFVADPQGTLFRAFGGGHGSLVLCLLVSLAPATICFAIVRDWTKTAQFAVISLGMILFAVLWNFAGGPRHQGYLFMALVGTVWMARAAAPAGKVAWLWIVLLVLNAIGGLTTVSAELRPYSQGYHAANWIIRHHYADAFLIGARDATTSPIASYLNRPLYYLECECFGTHVVWNKRRKRTLKPQHVIERVARGMAKEHAADAILILSLPYELEGQSLVPELSFKKIKQFPPAVVDDETYAVYRVTRRSGN